MMFIQKKNKMQTSPRQILQGRTNKIIEMQAVLNIKNKHAKS